MYFSGSFLFKKASTNTDLINISALIYTLGGFFFTISGIYIVKRYSYENQQQSKHIEDEELY